MTALFYPKKIKRIDPFSLAFVCLVFLVFFQRAEGAYVYGPSPHFYTEYCGYNTFNQGNNNVVCLFSYPQTDVVRSAISLTQVSKPSGYDLIFSTSFALSSNYPFTSMTISVGVGSSTTHKLGFSVLLIRTPTVASMPYIDFIYFAFGAGTALHNSQPTIRSTSQLNNINIDSILTTADTSTLKLIPFIVHLTFYIDTATVMNDPRYQYDSTFQYQVTAYSSNSIKHQLTIQPYSTMTAFYGFALMINMNFFNADRNAFIANSALTPNDYIFHKFKIGNTAQGALTLMDFQGNFGSFGTSFNHKCILGIQKIKFTRMTQFQFNMKNNTYGSFQSYTQQLTTPSRIPQSTNTFFCHGYNVECSDSTPYYDWTDGGCYIKTACPLPIPNAMPYPYRCSWCIQFICKTCNPSNRAECITCAPSTNSVLNTATKKCECNPGFYPVYIDLAPHNYAGATQSLFSCSSNCTQAMRGCVQNQCTSQNYCSQCLTGYLLIPSGPNQYCQPCSNFRVKCLQCSNTQYCTRCEDGFYLYNVMHDPGFPGSPYVVGKACTSCLSHCKSCNGGSNCNQCFKGYKLQSSNTVCKCDPTQSGLQNCQSCNVDTACATCNSGYFLSPITGLCIHCVYNHIGCKTCNNKDTCTSCIDGYGLINIGPNTYCDVCFLNINYCDRCSDLNTCTRCLVPFGIDNPSLCTHCSILKGPGCIQCLDATSPCTKCNSLSFLINGSCFFCQIVHPQCLSCQINPTYQVLDCIQCKPGYYSHFNPVTNTKQCFLCINAIHKCLQCQNQTYCTKCQYPNVLSSNNLCENCDIEFANYDGKCMRQAGCMNIYQITPGDQICLACRDNLHYIYQYNHHLCDCSDGYVETIDAVPQKKCVPLCGDGILIEPQQQCDDLNINDHDGCDSNCRVQTNFKCSKTSPSKCVLYTDFNKFEFVYVQRVLSENKGILHFIVEPLQVGLSTVDWSKILSFNFSSTAVNLSQITYKYVLQRGQLLVAVPYSEDLQKLNIKYTVIFDPDMIVSQPSFFSSTQKLIGINAPLIIEDLFLLSTCRVLGFISLALSILALIQFYVGSYMNKMIGLETIQIIQLTFFIRIVVSHKNTSIMNCLNSLKYCSTGYSNPQVIFGTILMKKNQQILHEFLEIGIEKYFLMNVNFWLIPVGLAVILYFLLMIRRQTQKHNFLQGKQTQSRQKFIKMHRSLQWFYNHFVFPQVMMFVIIVHFSVILSLELDENYDTNQISKIYMQSIGLEMFLQFGIYIIFTHQIFQSLNSLLHPFRQQPLSPLQKLQLDEQSPDRPNYHPFYVFCYLIFYLIQILTITIGVEIEAFHFAIETVLGLNVLYLYLIHRWQPYFKAVHIHNTVLKFNHVVAIVSLLIYEIVHRSNPLGSLLYIVLVSIMLVLIFFLIMLGFYRAYKQQQYRNKISFTSKNNIPKDTDLFEDHKKFNKKQRKQALLQKNSYAFRNQFEELKKSYNINRGYSENKKITQQDQKEILKKIREQFKVKNNFYSDFVGDNHNQSFQDGLLNPLTPNSINRMEIDSKRSRTPSQVNKQSDGKNQINQRNDKLNTKKTNSSTSKTQKESLQRLRNRLKAEWSYMQQGL